MMKFLMIATALMLGMAFAPEAQAQYKGERFQKVIYVAHGGSTANNGTSYQSAKPFGDIDLWAIPAGAIIDKVYAIVDEAVAGTTDFDLGDDDQSDDFLDGSVSLTLGTPGMYGWNAKVAGAYLRVQTAGATDAADIYVVPNAKYYAASGKELKMDATGASSAGKVRIVVEGYFAGGTP